MVSDLSGEVFLLGFDFCGLIVLVLGLEGDGISKGVVQVVDKCFKIF